MSGFNPSPHYFIRRFAFLFDFRTKVLKINSYCLNPPHCRSTFIYHTIFTIVHTFIYHTANVYNLQTWSKLTSNDMRSNLGRPEHAARIRTCGQNMQPDYVRVVRTCSQSMYVWSEHAARLYTCDQNMRPEYVRVVRTCSQNMYGWSEHAARVCTCGQNIQPEYLFNALYQSCREAQFCSLIGKYYYISMCYLTCYHFTLAR